MSQTLLYHAFGIKGVTYRNTQILGNALIFSVETTTRHVSCPTCGYRYCHFKGRNTRWLRMPPIGRKQAVLRVSIHRLQCAQCRNLWWPRLPFAQGNTRYTRSFATTVLELLRFGTIQAVAEHLHVSWDLVKEIHKNWLAAKYRAIDLSAVRYLGIDEFSLRKRHTYMTIFVDLLSGRILHAVEGTSKDAIAPFLRTVAKKAKQLKAVTIDMSTSYTSAVKEYLPNVPIVFDRYHVMALINRQIDALRREQQHQLDNEGTKTLKGSRFLLLRNYHELPDDKKGHLNDLLTANQPLFTLHAMKEQLRLFWSQGTADRAKSFLLNWCFDALTSGVKQLNAVGSTILASMQGLLGYYPHKITNGPLEGLNNKIKTMKRQAYGFRDMEYFKLRLYNLHNSGYAFAG